MRGMPKQLWAPWRKSTLLPTTPLSALREAAGEVEDLWSCTAVRPRSR
jgi:hypothetical protein